MGVFDHWSGKGQGIVREKSENSQGIVRKF